MKNINGRQYEDYLAPAENPINSVHDMKTTQETIKKLLANGTPDWVRFPHEYKAFVKESFAREKEISDTMAKSYQIEDQDILSNPEGRKVNAMSTRDFIQKLRENGVRCFTVDNGYPPQTVALWAIRPGTDQAVYVCYLQVPAMYEWSVLKLDRHNVPSGEDFRGWRTVLSQLIIKDILSEDRAHQIFGKPALNKISRVYRRTLYFHRNRKRFEAPALNS
jgi:hypothetical protein